MLRGRCHCEICSRTLYIHNHFTALFRDHPGEPVPEENFWTLWWNGRLTEADTPTIRLDTTPSRLTSAHLHHPPFFYRSDVLPADQPTASKHWKQAYHTLYILNDFCIWYYEHVRMYLHGQMVIQRYVNLPHAMCLQLSKSEQSSLVVRVTVSNISYWRRNETPM